MKQSTLLLKTNVKRGNVVCMGNCKFLLLTGEIIKCLFNQHMIYNYLFQFCLTNLFYQMHTPLTHLL